MSMFAPVLYWFPKRQAPTATLAARFLDAEGRDCGSFARGSEGPKENTRGLLASPFPGAVVTYRPSLQRWDCIGDGVYIGAERDADPAAFARPPERRVPGRLVTMGDGKAWLVPVANPLARTCSLPTWKCIGPDGETWLRVVQDAYRDIGDRAAEMAARMRAALLSDRAQTLSVDDGEARRLIAGALALNYDATIYELSVLRVFSDEAVDAAVRAVVDWDEMVAAIMAELGGRAGESRPFGGGQVTAGSST